MNPIEQALLVSSRLAKRSPDAGERRFRACDRNRRPLARETPAAGTVTAQIELVVRHQAVVHAAPFAVDADVAGLGLRAAVVTTGHANAQVARDVREPRPDALARRDAETARAGPRARDDVVARCRQAEAECRDARDDRLDVLGANVANHQVLILHGPDLVEPEPPQQ